MRRGPAPQTPWDPPVYPLHCTRKEAKKPSHEGDGFRKTEIETAWLSSARVVRCWVKSRNERNPCPMLPARCGGDSWGTAGVNSEEGGDDVKSSHRASRGAGVLRRVPVHFGPHGFGQTALFVAVRGAQLLVTLDARGR